MTESQNPDQQKSNSSLGMAVTGLIVGEGVYTLLLGAQYEANHIMKTDQFAEVSSKTARDFFHNAPSLMKNDLGLASAVIALMAGARLAVSYGLLRDRASARQRHAESRPSRPTPQPAEPL